jgi:hypothetical protein
MTRGADVDLWNECLDKIVFLGQGHLLTTVREYFAHYHAERHHQGLGGRVIVVPTNENRVGPTQWGERLGRRLRFYRRKPRDSGDRETGHHNLGSFRASRRNGLAREVGSGLASFGSHISSTASADESEHAQSDSNCWFMYTVPYRPVLYRRCW